MNRRLALPILAVALLCGHSRADDGADFFERRIRPLFTGECLGCHGPKVAKAGLRLDSKAGFLKGSESGPIVSPGSLEESLLIEAVRRHGPNPMPPKRALGAEAVRDLETWVKLGAPWPDREPKPTAEAEPWRRHWAFQPVKNPAMPRVSDPSWCRTSVDPFILGSLEANRLKPSREASRPTLIRRLSFDLIGLPPTPEEIERFVNDRDPLAYERLVDRLLASPHHGERWARHWLDVARYADTKGYVFFEDADFTWAYTYRDYVIQALNDDRPYDRFVTEQIAADLLPDRSAKPRGRTLAALGFLSLGGHFMNNPHDIIDDRIDVVTRGLLGLTVSCARCHDHKFDPVTTADYYALHGVFASTTEPDVPPLLDEPPDTPAYRSFAAELGNRESKLAAFVESKRSGLIASSKARVAEYLLAANAAKDQPTVVDFMLIADVGDLNPTMIGRWRAYLDRTRRTADPVWAAWHALVSLPQADFARRSADYCRSTSDRRLNPLIADALAANPPTTLAEAAKLYAKLLNRAESIGQEHTRRAALNRTKPEPLPIPAYQQLWEVFHTSDMPMDLESNAISLLELLPDRASQGQLKDLQKAVETWRATGPGAPPRAMAIEDKPVPVEPRVFVRGNPLNLGPAVPRRFVQALSGPEAKPFPTGSGRLELARAIASAENPLTARVLVNRVWAHHFGTPLVATPSDFGLRSDPPSHPELLDHLGYTLVHDDHWSIKALHRRIVLSATYRQVSDDRPEPRAIDPENRLYWRMNRRRVDLESLRDACLSVAGRLDPAIGGPPFADLTALDNAKARRTLYAKIDRLNLPGLYRTFDFPDPNATSPRRDQTTVPPQALFLMNHPFALTASKAMLTRPDVARETDPLAKIARLFRLAFGRPATPREIDLARGFVNDPDGGWDRFAQTLLLSNEFAFID